jgi:RIO kinase 1
MREAYVQTILIMRHLYQRCNLVHGDLSEYNLLWHNTQIFVIDVSQSVGSDHPAALDFLRKDASNVNDYFEKVGKLDVMTTRQLFDFTTTVITGGETAEVEYLEKNMREVEESYSQLENQTDQARRKQHQQDAVDEAVFMSSFLPRSLNQVADYDIRQLENGEVEETYAHAVAALTGNQDVVDAYKNYQVGQQGLPLTSSGKAANTSTNVVKEDTKDATDGDSGDGDSVEDDEECDDSDQADSDEEDARFVKVRKTQEELEAEKSDRRDERRANKKAVRGEKSEKRLTKIKKKDKKRAIKKAKAGNTRK